MTQQPEVPRPCGEPVSRENKAFMAAEGRNYKDERRLVAAAVRVLMRLPRAARYGLLALALGGAAEVSGGLDALLDPFFTYDPLEGERPSRAYRPDLRLERADQEEIDR